MKQNTLKLAHEKDEPYNFPYRYNKGLLFKNEHKFWFCFF